MSIKPELTGKRDLTYSKWHRTLGQNCYVINLDWVEYRWLNGAPKIVALIEDKIDLELLSLGKTNIARWQEKQMPIFLQIARALNVPGYLVLHTAHESNPQYEKWIFSVKNLLTGESQIMDVSEYRAFIENLGVNHG